MKKVFFIIIFFLFLSFNSYASERVGIITDTILTPVNYYNAYFRTPEFFAQDVRHALYKRNVQVVSVEQVQEALKNSGLKQQDLEALQSLSQGYNVEYSTLSKVAKKLNVDKLIVITMGMDIQRDFLKNTMWNILNVPWMDVVNPTHRVSVYCALVDVKRQNIIWESIYAKNIRNNKMKNLDTAISNNYEGMLRLKEYSKYISPDIAYNIDMKLKNENFVQPPTYITKSNLKKYAKERHNIGSKKELSEINRQKWDTDKLINDTKTNIKTKTNDFKQNVGDTAEDLGFRMRKLKYRLFNNFNKPKRNSFL